MKMREIKFRLYSESANRVIYPDEKGWFDRAYLSENGYWQHIRINTALLFPNKVTIMQYTGLKDVHSKEIYEGDIVSFSGYANAIGVIRYNERLGAYQAVYKDSRWLICKEVGGEQQVIGNIYENPELLGASK